MRRIALVLFVAGLLLVPAHYLLLQSQPVSSDENWHISLDINHSVKQDETIISIQPPYESAHIRMLGRNIDHAGLRIVTASRNTANKRGIRLSAATAGSYQVGVEFSLQLSQSPHFQNPVANLLSTSNRQLFLSDSEWLQLQHPALEAELNDIAIEGRDHEELVEQIFQFAFKLASHNQSTSRKVPEVLVSLSANHRERALLMVALCRKAGIPARVVTGLELMDEPAASPLHWVEVYLDQGWLSYHPGLGYAKSLPVNYVALDKTGDGIVSAYLTHNESPQITQPVEHDILIERMPYSVVGTDVTHRKWYQVLMLERLPLETREQLSLLMLLPLGALLCSVIRQFAGLHSYGVFTPTMLALAITYADKETTFLILLIALVLVYLGRPTFHHKMSRTPRLSIIFTLVAISMVVGISILDHFSLATGGHLVLLPLVIITSLIDRLFSTIELNGYHSAIIRLIWTLILTLITLPVLQLEWLGNWLLRYPEMHLFTLSLLILVSEYPFGKHKIPAWLSFLSEPEKNAAGKNSRQDNEA